MRTLLLALVALLVLPSYAQLLMVTGEYRVVETDRPEHRIGIALREDDPSVRQNWVYVDLDTQISQRQSIGGGAYRDVQLGRDQMWNLMTKGRKFRVHGGRDWNGTIVAKKIWM